MRPYGCSSRCRGQMEIQWGLCLVVHHVFVMGGGWNCWQKWPLTIQKVNTELTYLFHKKNFSFLLFLIKIPIKYLFSCLPNRRLVLWQYLITFRSRLQMCFCLMITEFNKSLISIEHQPNFTSFSLRKFLEQTCQISAQSAGQQENKNQSGHIQLN